MKNILVLAIGLLFFGGATAQSYYYVPHVNAGQNPGGLNNDDEDPTGGLPATWTEILDSSATPKWSTNQTIPFSFNFNGSAVTEYKVSNSGVLTFSTSVTAVPGFTNDYIPSSSIPDQSVMAWGIQGTGSNDGIATKTFGTPPNRQHWIFFASYTLYDYTYWSIVLEEGTDRIYIVDQRNSPAVTGGLTVGVQVDGATASSVLGSPQLSPLAGNDNTPADNGYYEFIYGTQNSYDLEGTSIDMEYYAIFSEGPQTVTGTLTNFGSATITSMDLNWQVLGFPVASESLTGLNIMPYNSYSFSHSDTWTPIATGTYDISVWASNINGNPDEDTSNDTVTVSISVVSEVTEKINLYEIFTSSTCGPCVAGNANLESLFGDEPEGGIYGGTWTMVKYQMNWPGNGDPYYTAEGNSRKNFYGVTGVPNLEIDGFWGQNPSTLGSATVQEFQDNPSFVELTSDYTINGQTVDVNVHVNPLAEVPAFFSSNLTLHIAIVEKETYNNTGTNGETYFQFVMKKMLPNASGTSLSSLLVGSPMDFTESFTFNGSYVLPPNAGSPINNNIEHSVEEFGDLMVVAWIQDMGSMEVHQSAWSELECTLTTFISPTDATCGLNDGEATVTVSGGVEPFTYQWNDPGAQNGATASNLTVGVYNVVVTDGAGCVTQEAAEISEVGAANLSGITVDNTCSDGNAGLASVMASGGTTPYTYLWSNGETTSNITNLFNGSYSVSVTDASGCTAVYSATVSSPDPIEITGTVTGETNGGDGTIDLDVDGGIPGYSYSWSNGSTTASLSGLVEGSYSVTVTDTYGCTASDSFAVGGIVSIQEAFSFNDIQLAPNPANSYFDIQFTTMSQQNVEVCVYDLLGKRMMQSNMTYGKGTHQKRVSCEGWIPGVYVAALKDNNGAGSYTKVVITNQQ